MNFSAGGQITINGNTNHPTSTSEDNSRSINDNSSNCTFYSQRLNQLTAHPHTHTHTQAQAHTYSPPNTSHTHPTRIRTTSHHFPHFVQHPSMLTSINTDEFINPPYPYNNHKNRVFQQSNQFKKTGIEIREELRNKDMKQRKNMRKRNNNNRAVNLYPFNEMKYGYAELLKDILYTHDAVTKMDEAYVGLLNSNARTALLHKYNNNNNNNNN
eukprot:148463_1